MPGKVVVEGGPMNRKDPGGPSGFVLIAESHIGFHTCTSRGVMRDMRYPSDNIQSGRSAREVEA